MSLLSYVKVMGNHEVGSYFETKCSSVASVSQPYKTMNLHRLFSNYNRSLDYKIWTKRL